MKVSAMIRERPHWFVLMTVLGAGTGALAAQLLALNDTYIIEQMLMCGCWFLLGALAHTVWLMLIEFEKANNVQ